jgi:hypothetical protein
VSSLTDRSIDGLGASVSRRGFCRASISAAALISSSAVPLFAQDGKLQDAKTAQDKKSVQEKSAGQKPSDKSKVAADGKPDGPTAADSEKSDSKVDKPDVKDAASEARQLFVPGQFPKGWFFFGGKDGVKLESTWKTTKDAKSGQTILQCLGKPYGYIRTLEVFDNYEFGLKWRFPVDPNGNSGILLHTEDDRIWPKSIQVQLHRPKAGSVFPSGEAKSDNQLTVKDLSKPLNQWNECVIRCVDSKISLEVNKKKVGEVTGCNPSKGKIALQSEGSEIHFQQIWVRKLS